MQYCATPTARKPKNNECGSSATKIPHFTTTMPSAPQVRPKCDINSTNAVLNNALVGSALSAATGTSHTDNALTNNNPESRPARTTK